MSGIVHAFLETLHTPLMGRRHTPFYSLSFDVAFLKEHMISDIMVYFVKCLSACAGTLYRVPQKGFSWVLTFGG